VSLLCEPLTWDSDFFGFPVARVRIGTLDPGTCRAVLEWCATEGVRLLYFLADDASSWAVATDGGFRAVDVRTEMVLDRSPPPWTGTLLSPGVVLRDATPGDLDELLPIAASAHTDSRFFVDAAVPRDRARELFKTWLGRSVTGAMADVVFVADLDGHAVSYITATLKGGVGNIGLVGVSESVRGRGIGVAMVQRALEWFAAGGAHEVTVVTQACNVVAQRLYQRCGFVTRSTRVWFHRWFA
jgi:dTDP-4-amino-4,6-dideoxy-D-galactose acyltransferase